MEWRRGIFGIVVSSATFHLFDQDTDEKAFSIYPEGGPQETIRIVRTHTGQWVFLCPHEGTQRLKLHIVDGQVGCRACHNLAYLTNLRGNYHRRKEAASRARNRRGAELQLPGKG